MIWQLLVCSGSIATNVWIGATTVGEVISLVARETVKRGLDVPLRCRFGQHIRRIER